MQSPHVASVALFERSGHWHNYQDSMFPAMERDNRAFAMKPMSCPFHIEMYRQLSPENLPLRLAEFGQVYRYEQSGELNGLFRCRSFVQDDAHIFLDESYLDSELQNLLDLFSEVYEKLELPIRARLSLRGQGGKYIGSDALWQVSEAALRRALSQSQIQFEVAEDEAAFYGPKIDFIAQDRLGRDWQMGSIQVDYNLPERFDLDCPIVLHRAIVGSLERAIAILLENNDGKLPEFLAPVRARLLPVSDAHLKFAQAKAKALGERVEVDAKGSLSARIKRAYRDRVFRIGIIGESEVASDSISWR